MKKLLIGLLALITINAFAQTKVAVEVNTNHPYSPFLKVKLKNAIRNSDLLQIANRKNADVGIILNEDVKISQKWFEVCKNDTKQDVFGNTKQRCTERHTTIVKVTTVIAIYQSGNCVKRKAISSESQNHDEVIASAVSMLETLE